MSWELLVNQSLWNSNFKLLSRELSSTTLLKWNGLFQKNPNRGEGWEHNFLKKNSAILRFVTSSLEIPEKNKSSRLEIPQNCVAPLGNFKLWNQDPWKLETNFPWSPLEIPLFTTWPQDFSHYLSSIPLKIPCPWLPPPSTLLFWNYQWP